MNKFDSFILKVLLDNGLAASKSTSKSHKNVSKAKLWNYKYFNLRKNWLHATQIRAAFSVHKSEATRPERAGKPRPGAELEK